MYIKLLQAKLIRKQFINSTVYLFLPPPRRLCFCHFCLFVCLFVCLLAR